MSATLPSAFAPFGLLSDILSDLPSHRSPTALLGQLTRAIPALVQSQSLAVIVRDPETGVFRLVAKSAAGTNVSLGYETTPADSPGAAWVIEHQQPRFDVLSADSPDPVVRALYAAGYRSIQWLPLSTPRRPVGAVVAARMLAAQPSRDDLQVLQQVTTLLALGLEYLQQLDETESFTTIAAAERDRTQLLLDITSAMASELDLDQLLALASASVQPLVPHHYASLLVWDDASHQLIRRALTFGQDVSLVQKDAPVAPGLPPQIAFDERRTLVYQWADIDRAGEPTRSVNLALGVKAFCCVPLITTRGIYGVFNIARPTDARFTPADVTLLEHVAKALAVATENALAHERSRRFAEDAVRQRNRLGLLLDLTTTIVGTSDLRSALESISKSLKPWVPHDFAGFMVWDDEKAELRCHAQYFPQSKGGIPKDLLAIEGSAPRIAFDTRQTIVVDWPTIEAFGEPVVTMMRTDGLRSLCVVPLTTPRAVTGVLVFCRSDDTPYSATELNLLNQVAAELAMAVELTVAHTKTRKYSAEAAAERDRANLLLAVNNALVSQLESHALRLSVLGVMRSALDHEYAALAVYDKEDGQLRVEALTSYDANGILEPHVPIPVTESPSGLAFTTRQARVFLREDLAAFPPSGTPTLRNAGIESLCSVPLITGRAVLGTLTIGRKSPHGFTPDEVRLLSEVASQVAIAVANTLAYEEILSLKERLTEQKVYLEDELQQRHDFTHIIGSSRVLAEVLRQVRTVAPTDATVLLLGETGTGKELLARALHDLSGRRDQPFVRVNASAIPATLFESELFGHEKGAFTGAHATKVGRLELANRGTLFFDEIGDIPLELQVKLLRALQEQEFERVGGTRTIKVNVRIVAATNRDLSAMVADGRFRSDLYYRLNVFPVRVPPLRERQDDIPELVQFFVRKFSREMGRGINTIAAADLMRLQQWPWPGNIRELENVVERAVILSPGSSLQLPQGLFDDLLAPGRESAGPGDQATASPVAASPSRTRASLREHEREIILAALRDSGGHVGGPDGAAARLGLKRTTLHSKMRKLGIARPSF